MNNSEIWAQRRKDAREHKIKFQPVIMVLHDQPYDRLECSCGAKATFINTELNEEGRIESVCLSCHDCYCKEDEETQAV